MRWVRSITALAVLAVFGIALALATAEVGVRALHLMPTRFWKPDPLLGTRLIAGKEGWWTQEELEFRVPIRINSAGFRDVEHSLAKPDGVFRTVVCGDSFIEALQVPLEDTMARQLESLLNRSADDSRHEVISLGVSGYGTASEWLAYREIGRLYHPDLVLIAFYPGNDVRNNSPRLETLLRPVYAEDGVLLRIDAAKKTTRSERSWPATIIGSSEAYRFFRKIVLTKHPEMTAWLIDTGLIQPGAASKPPLRDGVPLDFGVYAPDLDDDWRDAWQRTEALLQDFRRMVEERGARFALVIVAGREQIDPTSWEQIVAANPAMQDTKWDLFAPERRIASWCKRERIPCLRLSDAFLRARDPAAPLHYRYDGHWTPAGHRLAAETVAKYLRAYGVVGGGRDDHR